MCNSTILTSYGVVGHRYAFETEVWDFYSTFKMYSPHIYTVCHSNPVSYFTFAVSVPELVSVHFSCAIRRESFVVSQHFADHVIFVPFALCFPSVLAA